ncbi:MAG: hypothetical protein ACTSXQ_00490 [Alphaproteobacteria bacterium]
MKKLLFISLILLTTACVESRLTGFLNHEFSNKIYHSIIVHVPVNSLITRQKTENLFAEEFKWHDDTINVVRSIELFPPIKQYNGKEILETCLKKGIETAIVINFKDAGFDEAYIPTVNWSSTTNTTGYMSNAGYANFSSYTSPSMTTGGHAIRRPKATLSATLYDLKTQKIIWNSEVKTVSEDHGTFSNQDMDEVLYSAIEKISDELKRLKIYQIEN